MQTVQRASRNLKQLHVTGEKRGKMRGCKSRMVLVLHFIGWKSDASFAEKSQSEAKQNQSKRNLLWHSIENRCNN